MRRAGVLALATLAAAILLAGCGQSQPGASSDNRAEAALAWRAALDEYNHDQAVISDHLRTVQSRADAAVVFGEMAATDAKLLRTAEQIQFPQFMQSDVSALKQTLVEVERIERDQSQPSSPGAGDQLKNAVLASGDAIEQVSRDLGVFK
jgi:hypothetical protein